MNKEAEFMNLTLQEFMELKVAYKKAVGGAKKEFKFKGKDFFTGYAKYLIEYLESEYKKLKNV